MTLQVTGRWRIVPIAAAFVLAPGASRAEVPMFLVTSLLKFASSSVLVVVLLIETAALAWAFLFDVKTALLTSVIANAASPGAGLLVYPLLGGVFYPILAPFVIGWTGGGTGIEIVATLLAVSLVDTVIEFPVVARVRKVAITARSTAIFLADHVAGTAVLSFAITGWSNILPETIPDAEVARLEQHCSGEIGFMREIIAVLPEIYDTNGKVVE